MLRFLGCVKTILTLPCTGKNAILVSYTHLDVYKRQKCATAKKHKGCKQTTVRKQWLADLVVNQTMQLVKDDAAMESIIAKVMELQDQENTNLPLYEKQLRDAESGIQNMLCLLYTSRCV